MLNGLIRFVRATNSLEVAWIALWLGTMSFTQRTAAESLYGGVDVTHFQRFVFDSIALGLVVLNAGRLQTLKWDPITLLLMYALIGVFSTTWTVSTLATLGKSGELLIGVLIVWLTLTRRNHLIRLRRLIEWVAILLAALLVIALAGYILNPDAFSEPSPGILRRRMTTFFLSANGIAYSGALLSLLCLARFLILPKGDARRTSYLCLLLFFLMFPVLAEGRTGLAMVLAGGALLVFRRSPVVALLFVIPPFVLLTVLFGAEVGAFFLRGQAESQFLGLSGRVQLWAWAWDAFLEKPLLGAGFGVGSRYLFLKELAGFFPRFGDTISSVHSGFFEVLLGTGLLGFSIWVTSFFWGVYLATTAYLRGQSLDTCILFIYLVGTTIMSTGVGGWMGNPVAIFLAATAYLYLARREERHEIAGRPPVVPQPGGFPRDLRAAGERHPPLPEDTVR